MNESGVVVEWIISAIGTDFEFSGNLVHWDHPNSIDSLSRHLLMVSLFRSHSIDSFS